MTTLVNAVNALMRGLSGLTLWPLQRLDPIWAITFISFLTALLMLWIFGKVSNQAAIRHLRDKVRGNLLAVRLYRHDVKVVLQLQGSILKDTLSYMRYSLVPMLVLAFPVLLVMAQLNLYFSVRPLEPGQSVVVKAKIRDTSVLKTSITLDAPPGVEVETQGIRIESGGEVVWKVRAQEPGRYLLTVRSADESVEKELYVGQGWGEVSGVRTGSWTLMLLNPGEPPINPSRVIESIEVRYRPLALSIWDWNIHWLTLFFIFSVVFAFAFKRFMGVEI